MRINAFCRWKELLNTVWSWAHRLSLVFLPLALYPTTIWPSPIISRLQTVHGIFSLSVPQNLLSEGRHSDGSYCALAIAPASVMPHPISFHPRNKNCILIGQLDWSLIRQPGFGSHESRPRTHLPYPSSSLSFSSLDQQQLCSTSRMIFFINAGAFHLQHTYSASSKIRVWEEGNHFKILGLMTTISFGLWVQMGLISAVTT